MRMSEAHALMKHHAGYRVHFERREGGMLHTDYFPADHEPTITEVDDAWRLAEEFARVNPSIYVNVYVVSARDFAPVRDYQARRLNTYPAGGTS